jgi:hypothetical protein
VPVVLYAQVENEAVRHAGGVLTKVSHTGR